MQHCYACLSLRATRRRGKSKLKRSTPPNDELTSTGLRKDSYLCLSRNPCIPRRTNNIPTCRDSIKTSQGMNRFADKHGELEKTDAVAEPGRHGRARSH